jgi:1,4-alpha-glucan branching enzyme
VASTRSTSQRTSGPDRAGPGGISPEDLWYWSEGSHLGAYRFLGAHPLPGRGEGVRFAVWAPNAESVSVIGEFNGWAPHTDELAVLGDSGVWAGRVAAARPGQLYKYHIVSRFGGYRVDKADPFARQAEIPPGTASRIVAPKYRWQDAEWRAQRSREPSLRLRPQSIYEVHLGSFRRVVEEGRRSMTYGELARFLPDYVTEMGFTHVEFLPVMEHPFYGSWGYETTGYFAPTARWGPPEGLMELVDRLHAAEIGVLFDWVPSHFPADGHGLGYFDGTHLFEHADPRLGWHPDWNSCIFNYGRREVVSFLTSSAHFWIDQYHADGLRVDAVASMLYRDYSRPPGEWIPNARGGRENEEAIGFLRHLNTTLYREHPGIETYAEESTAWPMVSRPVELGGLGFGFKWDMGWMHDWLRYLARDPLFRRYHHSELTFRGLYALHENYVLPLSHDEVDHGKGSLLRKMPGDDAQRFAQIRLLFGGQYGLPGKKLLFMGSEWAPWNEWYHETSLDWDDLDRPEHAGVQRWVTDLNRLYRREPALSARDYEPDGFQWLVADDADQSILAFLRRGEPGTRPVVVVLNFTPVPRFGYTIGVPSARGYAELANSDAREYGGGGLGNLGRVETRPEPSHGQPSSIDLTLPPLAALFLAPQSE